MRLRAAEELSRHQMEGTQRFRCGDSYVDTRKERKRTRGSCTREREWEIVNAGVIFPDKRLCVKLILMQI